MFMPDDKKKTSYKYLLHILDQYLQQLARLTHLGEWYC